MSRKEVAELRRSYIEEKRNLLTKKVSAVELKLYNAILDKLINELDQADGKLIYNDKNINLSAALNKIFKDINKNDYYKIIQSFGGDLIGSLELNKKYFEIVADDKKKLEKAAAKVDETMQARIGIDAEGKLINKGYLSRLITDDTFQREVKRETIKAITSNKSFEGFKRDMQKLIIGNGKVDGGLAKHLNTFAYDTYEQFNRATSKEYAVKLDLKAFIYAGGLIGNSRCFCDEHNGMVFTSAEAQEWRNDLNSECGPIWDENTDGPYDPLTMMGGYRCRHTPDFISNTLAKKLRPDIAL